MNSGASALQIFVLHNGQLLASEVFGDGEYSIGRDVTSDLILPHDGVSAHHATLTVREGRAALVDEESDLGTIVNGQAVHKALLNSADEIYMGPFLLKVRPLNRRTAPLPPTPVTVRRPTPLMPTPLPAMLGRRASPASHPRPLPAHLRPAPQPSPQPIRTLESLAEKTLVNPPPHPVDDDLDDLPEVTAEPVSVTNFRPPPVATPPASVAPVRVGPPKTARPPLRKELPPRLLPAPPPPNERPRVRTKGARERLFVRVLWGERLVSVHSFGPSDPVVAAADETAPLPLHGFNLGAPSTLARASKGNWTIHPPAGATVAFRDRDGRWRPSATSRVRQYVLPAHVAARLTVGSVHVEFACESVARMPRWRPSRVDPVFVAILLPLLIAGVVLIRKLPHFPKTPAPQEAERFTKYMQAMQARAKPPPPEKAPKVVEKVAAPKPVAQAETLKAASATLKTVEKVSRATRQIDSLLDSLHRVTLPGRGAPRESLAGLGALPSLPSLGNLSASNHGLGDVGAPGGPLTRGLGSMGNAGALGGATAGAGQVRGIPIKVPRRPTQVQGQIDRDALARVINEHVDEMRGCYERALMKDPTLGGGKVTLEWTIGPGGEVMDIGTKTSSLRSSEVVTCLLGVVRPLRFPKPEGGVVIVSYPILFNSVGY